MPKKQTYERGGEGEVYNMPLADFLRNPDGSILRIGGKIQYRPGSGGIPSAQDIAASDWSAGRYRENPRWIGTVASEERPQIDPRGVNARPPSGYRDTGAPSRPANPYTPPTGGNRAPTGTFRTQAQGYTPTQPELPRNPSARFTQWFAGMPDNPIVPRDIVSMFPDILPQNRTQNVARGGWSPTSPRSGWSPTSPRSGWDDFLNNLLSRWGVM